MSFNRTPQAVPGMLLIGDAAGAVNPFNGEGIAYAMETGEIAAELVHEALVKDRPGPHDELPAGPATSATARYFTIGRLFATIDRAARDHGAAPRSTCCPNPTVMGFAMRVMANLTDGTDGDAQDKLFYLLERLARAA